MSTDPAPPHGEGPRAGTSPVAAPAIRGSIWTMGGYAAGQVLRLAGNVILTRLLFPAVFGEMTLVFVFIVGLQMFSDVGTGPAIIQSRRGDDASFLNTAWTIQSARGVVLWLTAWAIAWPVAGFYGDPALRWLIPAAATNALISGFESTSMHALQRHLRLERLTITEVGSQVVGLGATVLLAAGSRWLLGPNDLRAVWAMIAGSVVTSVTRLVLSHTYLPGVRSRFLLDRRSMDELFHFGRWIFVSTLLTFFAVQADRLIFGKMIPIALLGVYSIGSTLAALPTEAVAKLGSAVVFPAYSRVAARTDFRDVFFRVRFPLVVGGSAVVTALLAGGPFLVGFLYDRRYADAGWIVQYLSAAAWFRMLEVTNEAALLATGRVRWMAAGNGAKTVGMVLAMPIGFRLGGFQGALLGVVVAEVAKYAAVSAGVAAAGLSAFGRDVLFTVAVAGASYAALAFGRLAAERSGANLVALVASTGLACVLWGGVALSWLARQRAARATVGRAV